MSLSNDEATVAALNTLFPPGFLKVVGFLIPADETTQELIDWYENTHSRNARVLWPYMNLYRRNYIMGVDTGPEPSYRVVTEFVWKSEADKAAAAGVFGTPAAAAMLNETLPVWLKPLDIPNTHGLVAVEPVGAFTQAPRRRRIVLLDRDPRVSPAHFDVAAKQFGRVVADALGVFVIVDLCRHSAPWPTTGAILYVNDDTDREMPRTDNSGVIIGNIFAVETRHSPL